MQTSGPTGSKPEILRQATYKKQWAWKYGLWKNSLLPRILLLSASHAKRKLGV